MVFTIQQFQRQEVLQPLQLQLTLGTLMHVRMCLQTRLHTHFRTRPICTKGYNYFRLFKPETGKQLRIRVVNLYEDRLVHFFKNIVRRMYNSCTVSGS